MFFCISYYQGNLDVLNHINECDYKIYSKGNQKSQYTEKLENYGYNISSYFHYIIDNYENLPERIVFIKNNIFPRHVKLEKFKQLLKKNNEFLGIEDPESYSHKTGISFYDKTFGFFEINNSWYLTSKKTKYFYSFNHFMSTLFTNYKKLDYINFVPGANFIINKELILKFPKNFYKNLNLFMSHCKHANESHLIERALKLIFTGDLHLNDSLKKPLSKSELKKISLKTYLLRKTHLLKPLNKFHLI